MKRLRTRPYTTPPDKLRRLLASDGSCLDPFNSAGEHEEAVTARAAALVTIACLARDDKLIL